MKGRWTSRLLIGAAVLAGAATLVLSGCSVGADRPAASSVASRPPGHARHCVTVSAATNSTRFLAAVARTRTTVYRAPGFDVVAHFRPRNRDRFPTVFSVLTVRMDARCRPAWYRVELPTRPNGATGWVSARDVAVSAVQTMIVIHVGARRLEERRAGRVVFASAISTGAPDSPTPVGRFYVKERLIPADPNGPWGPAALGTFAYSSVLKSWVEGGPIGIHGTDDPTAIGRPVSHGC